MSAQPLNCPVVEDDPADLDSEAPAKYAACRPLPLRQYWVAANILPREAGVARIGASSKGLSVHVRYEDSDIFSTATANQQRMWQLGDVVEVFVKPGLDRTDYWEVHVTPNAFLMDLHIPSRPGMQTGEHTWEEIIAPESGTTYRTKVGDGWWAADRGRLGAWPKPGPSAPARKRIVFLPMQSQYEDNVFKINPVGSWD